MSSSHWDIAQSRALYQIEYWSDGYFDINTEGELIITPFAQDHPPISLYQLAQNFTAHGLTLPVLVRFSNILQHRVVNMQRAFEKAMKKYNYSASYTAVYPIKVNQQYHVIKEILAAGQTQVGLEAGSKPELMAVLALAPAQGGIVICNGYKDHQYIRLALIGQQMGLIPYLVIEKLSELDFILEESRAMNVVPRLGIRVRLASISKGKWQNTGGEKAKFGLSSAQVLEVITRIKRANLLSSLQLMHFHAGSQIANIHDIQNALREAAHYYVELQGLGVPIHTVDIGGGLGIDYNGTRSRHACSMNYNIEEYANNVIHEFSHICQRHKLAQPNIITESGRAMSAHHAVLITNVIDVERVPTIEDMPTLSTINTENAEPLQNLLNTLENLPQRSLTESYHDAVYSLNEIHSLFAHGVLNLTQRAYAEQLYYAICQKIWDSLQTQPRIHREIQDELYEKLADKYFCNFSVFQSIPDAWAIDQLFPVVPLHRLDEKPERRATIQDLTCDSDGRLDFYVDGEGVETSLPIHVLKPKEPYLLGIFLVGAYQEILGDMHNLLGDTYSVNVRILADGNYELVAPVEGDTVQEVLHFVRIESDFLRNTYRRRIQAAMLTTEQRQNYLRELDAGLMGYTYLER